jgi:endoglucanase
VAGDSHPVCLTKVKEIVLLLWPLPVLRQLKFRNDASFGAFGHRCGSVATATLLAMVLATESPDTSWTDPEPFASNRLLGRGMNLGNALDAPEEGAWGVTLKSEYFQAIKDAGFNSVRIPIRWSAHAQTESPYAISPAFFRRVDWAIDQALSRNLSAVINVHHYVQMNEDPVGNASRLLALWKQIAARYRDRPKTLFFELFNEPQDKLTDQRWDEIFPELLHEIRDNDPMRIVIIGPSYWNSLDHLPLLHLPQNDRRLIVTFHYYKPLRFTHQAQGWMPNSMAWKGTGWGTPQDRNDLHEDFANAAAWADQNHRPLYLGEFGVSEGADGETRASWTRAVAREAEQLGFSWAYWQFCSNFNAYDTVKENWNQQMLKALMDRN